MATYYRYILSMSSPIVSIVNPLEAQAAISSDITLSMYHFPPFKYQWCEKLINEYIPITSHFIIVRKNQMRITTTAYLAAPPPAAAAKPQVPTHLRYTLSLTRIVSTL